MKKITLFLYDPVSHRIIPTPSDCKKTGERTVGTKKRRYEVVDAEFYHPFLKKNCTISLNKSLW